MKKIGIAALVWALILGAWALGEETEAALGPFEVRRPEGWTLTGDGLEASLVYGRMDAYVYMNVTDLGQEISTLPALTALGDEYVLRMFARATFSCRDEDIVATEVAGCPAVRVNARVQGVNASCAAVIRDWKVLTVVSGDVAAGLGREAVLDIALDCVGLREGAAASGGREGYPCGAFALPAVEGAAWHHLDGETGYLLFDDGLTTVSAQYERLEGSDVPEMVETVGAEYYMESASKYFGGEGYVRGGEILTTSAGILALRMEIDAARLMESMLAVDRETLLSESGFDLEKCTAQGVLLMEGEYTATLIVISADPDRPALDVAQAILDGAQLR